MQDDKIQKFKIAAGELLREIRENETKTSLSKLCLEYDFDKGNLSKTERGQYKIYLLTAWRLSEALGLKFSDFIKRLEDKLGEDFRFYDD